MWYLELLSSLHLQVDLWQRLPEVERDAFAQAYARRVSAAYPRPTDGTTVLPFQRLFFVARRGGQAAAGSAAG